jgi:iron(III) transport system permease protein
MKMGRIFREPLLFITLLLVLAGLGFFVLYPMISVFTYPSIHDFLSIAKNARYLRAIYNTFIMVLLSTVSAVSVGFLFAYTFTRTDVPLKRIFRVISLVPGTKNQEPRTIFSLTSRGFRPITIPDEKESQKYEL